MKYGIIECKGGGSINIQGKINKLVMAFNQMGKVIKISSEQFYSTKYHKTFTEYKVQETTEEEILKKRELYELKKKYKDNKSQKLLDRITELQLDIKNNEIPSCKYRSKIDILLHLSRRYKELIE